ncbi:hypothetical protein B0O80DRAFT_514646 [Mortierella sp. GBAus27b]|nr:hypothetical protein B0O80DRAFT_514646 [Mortierella sp. GBAus27b]
MDTVDLSSGTSSHSTTATPAPAPQVFSVRPGLATLAAQLAFSMERQLYDNHLKWSSLADERLAALRAGNTELAASIKDMMTDLTEAPISSSKVARLAADATPVMAATWSRFMEVHVGYLEQHGRLTPDELRQVWGNSLAQSERYSYFLTTTWKETGFVDSEEVMRRLRASFANDSEPFKCLSFDSVVWEVKSTFLEFLALFKHCAVEAGFSLEQPSMRSYLAHRFLQCLPAEWDLSTVMMNHQNAPPLQVLIDAAQQHAVTSDCIHGLGHFGRLNDSLRRLYARSPSTVSASASSGIGSGTSSGSGSGSIKVTSTADVSSSASSPSVSSLKRKAGHAESSSSAKRVVSGSNAVRSAPFCYRCNADGHLSPQCRAEGYADRNAFRPVNGVRPSGGLRGKPSSARVGFLGPASSSVASVSDPSSPYSGFRYDQYDDDELSLLQSQIPCANKPDDLHALYRRVRTVNLIDQDRSSYIRFQLLVDDIPLVALVDTGSSVTCISTRALPKLDVQTIPAADDDATIQLAHAGITIPRIGVTSPVLLDTGSASLSHHCEILDLPAEKL